MLNKHLSLATLPKQHFKKLLAAIVFSITLIGCDKDDNVNTNSAAYKIAVSEQLVIPAAIELPANLPGGNSRIATYYAEGVQKYKAQVKTGTVPVQYEWVFVAPKADLFNANNQKVGTHGAGPYWALSATDSIFAQHFTPVKSVAVESASIPWLQLMPKAGKIATGVFAGTDYIQRIATTGGKAPATAPQNITDTAEVFYTAVYRFAKMN
jgi:hypothetical protein